MVTNSLFGKQVYIRLADDNTSFLYTVKYRWFRLPTRQVELSEQSESRLGAEVPLPKAPEFVPQPVRNVQAYERDDDLPKQSALRSLHKRS